MIPDLDKMAIGRDRATEIGWSFIEMMYVFENCSWRTLKGARPYLHEGNGNPVVDFMALAADGRIEPRKIIDEIILRNSFMQKKGTY